MLLFLSHTVLGQKSCLAENYPNTFSSNIVTWEKKLPVENWKLSLPLNAHIPWLKTDTYLNVLLENNAINVVLFSQPLPSVWIFPVSLPSSSTSMLNGNTVLQDYVTLLSQEASSTNAHMVLFVLPKYERTEQVHKYRWLKSVRVFNKNKQK